MPKIETKINVGTGLPVSHKVGVSLLMASAAMIALSFMAALVNPSMTDSGLVQIRRPRSKPRPLVFTELSAATTNVPVSNATTTVVAYFIRSNSDSWMGQLILNDNRYDPGAPDTQGTAPLKLVLASISEMAPVVIPSSIMNLQTDRGNYAICVPATNLVSVNNKSYFYDTNGTPYLDSLLTQVAMTTPCNQILARGLKANIINDADINLAVPGYVSARFLRGASPDGELGHLFLNDNYYVRSLAVENSSVPLQMVLGTLDPANIPNSIITIQTDLATGISYSLCVPATTLGPAEEKSYFYDTNGTPYLDSLLMNRMSCVNKSNPQEITP